VLETRGIVGSALFDRLPNHLHRAGGHRWKAMRDTSEEKNKRRCRPIKKKEDKSVQVVLWHKLAMQSITQAYTVATNVRG
jgi:hypothetical protein